MTDTLEAQEPVGAHARICQREGCSTPLPVDAHRLARYCPEHAPAKKAPPKKRRDRPPTTIKVQLGAEKAAATDAAAKARVEQLVSMLAGTLAMAGQLEDAGDIMRNRDQFVLCVIELSKYEPWLKKLLAGGQASGRVMAWVALALATLAMTLPIFDRHGWVPAELAPAARALTGNAPPVPDDAAEPVAA